MGTMLPGRYIDGIRTTDANPYRPQKVTLELFLHVNHKGLTDFQREVIETVFSKGNLGEAIDMLNKQIGLLEQAGWMPKKEDGDAVYRPSHYDRYPIEPTYFIVENGIDWCLGNFLKYVCRFPFKNGIEDLRKAMRYLAMEVRRRDGDKGWSR